VQWLQNLHWKSEYTKKEIKRTSPFFCNSLCPIPNPFDQLRQKGVMRKDFSVSHGSTKMDKMVKRRELPCIGRLMPLHWGQVVRSAVAKLMKKKSDEGVKKKQ
jgi:hypothetical protein